MRRRLFCAAAAFAPSAYAQGGKAVAVETLASGLVKAPNGTWVAPDIARVMQRGELLVAMLAVDSPPFFQVRKGELVGTDVRMAQELATEMKVPLRIERSARTFDQVVGQVARGEADMAISKLSRTLARAQSVRFSEPYLRLRHALVLNRLEFTKLSHERQLVDVLRDFRGSIGVIANSSFAGYATRNFPKAKISTYPDWDSAVSGVRSGEVTALYRDELEIRRLILADPALALTLRVVTFSDLEDSLGIAFGWRDTALLSLANQYIAQAGGKLTVDKVLNELR